jgi:tellurite resistance protein TerC
MWGGFLTFIFLMLAIDLGLFHKKSHRVGAKEAAGWTAVWMTLALTFGGVLWHFEGQQFGTEFIAGYLIEQSLSMDNMFVFILIFSAMKIPPALQHRVLFWGILSALILRAIMIFAGVALLKEFHWLIGIFGIFLLYTGAKLLFKSDGAEEGAGTQRWISLLQRFIPSTPILRGHRFFWKDEDTGKWLATPLFMALILVELTDVVFALDSIPAVFGVTQDPFLIFTSNIFAILGLRSMFFLLAAAVDRFAYVKYGISAVLCFVGAKMMVEYAGEFDSVKAYALAQFGTEEIHISPLLSLGFIVSALPISITWSLIATKGMAPREPDET